MDTKALGDPINRMGDDEYVEDDDDFDDEELEPVTLGLKPVAVGFVEKPNNDWSLHRQYFPSKAGGAPAWLDPLSIPSGRSSTCDFCGDPLQFLLQHEQWKRHPEKPSRSVKVFRCQLPHINPFYSSEGPIYDASHQPACCGAALCDWCGIWKGDKLCSSYRQVRYCSEKHQGMSWRSGHKIACQQIKNSSLVAVPNSSGTTPLESRKVGSNNAWPEFEIVIEDENEYIGDISEDNTVANSLISSGRNDDTMNSLMEIFQGDDDKRSWAHFQECIAKAPEQVLRYYRNTNAKPIWPNRSGRPSKDDIPECSYCGGPMCCEIQIMPQLLYYFGIDNEVNSLDWATIVVYTCEASCEASLPYKHEFAWVQLPSPSAT